MQMMFDGEALRRALQEVEKRRARQRLAELAAVMGQIGVLYWVQCHSLPRGS